MSYAPKAVVPAAAARPTTRPSGVPWAWSRPRGVGEDAQQPAQRCDEKEHGGADPHGAAARPRPGEAEQVGPEAAVRGDVRGAEVERDRVAAAERRVARCDL